MAGSIRTEADKLLAEFEEAGTTHEILKVIRCCRVAHGTCVADFGKGLDTAWPILAKSTTKMGRLVISVMEQRPHNIIHLPRSRSCQLDATGMANTRIFPVSPCGQRIGRRAPNLSERDLIQRPPGVATTEAASARPASSALSLKAPGRRPRRSRCNYWRAVRSSGSSALWNLR